MRNKIIGIILGTILVGSLYAGYTTLSSSMSPTALFPRARLEWAKARWEAANIHNYRMTVRYFNPNKMCDYTMTVKDGHVTAVDRRERGLFDEYYVFPDGGSCNDGTELTVESLFDLVESARNTQVTFSWQGYVTYVRSSGCGWLETYTVHCLHYSYVVTNFEILQDSG